MTRSEILNIIIKNTGYKKYLEIGVNTPSQPGYSHDNIDIAIKHGVDPNVDTTFKMTSDEFFAKNSDLYDIILIDGLHVFDQVHRDIINSLKYLSPGGTIVVHDCNPKKEITQQSIRETSIWHGDVWKAILKLRTEQTDISLFTVDADEGCAVIQRGYQKLFAPNHGEKNIYTFAFFKDNKQDILNLISAREFKKKYGIETSLYKKIVGSITKYL